MVRLLCAHDTSTLFHFCFFQSQMSAHNVGINSAILPRCSCLHRIGRALESEAAEDSLVARAIVSLTRDSEMESKR